jgi:glucuronate isomerase
MEFIHDDFLLHSEMARRLYHDYAADEPVLDYHSHLPPADVASDHRFENLWEIWLKGDHYKWRLMRANGVSEDYCTGMAPPYEKFLAWARTVPYTLRSPLYLWTHLELKRYFAIGELLDENNANRVWERANSALKEGDLTAQGILRRFKVRAVCSTDDPCDDLSCHQALNGSSTEFRMYPTFRPDKAFGISIPEAWNAWVDRLQAAAGKEVSSFNDFLDALRQRHDFFHANGGRLSDHGIARCYATPCTDREAAAIFAKARIGTATTEEEQEKFASFLMLFFGRLDAEKGWTKQLHLGALRSVNSRRSKEVGLDTGYDSVGDWEQAAALGAYLDQLEQEHSLPKTIVYNVNPADNYVLATAIGNFQDGSIAGKIQFGSAWWFLDQKDGIEWQLNALSNTGLLSRFVGMLTDSRSFMSFPRHEYFRRVLCDLLGRDVENGELPNDEKLLGNMVRNICFNNARDFLGLELPPVSTARSRG